MKLVTYSIGQNRSYGILTQDGIIDIPSQWKGKNPPRCLREFLEGGPEFLNKLSVTADSTEILPMDSVRLHAPITKPGKILALAGNYSEHIIEAGLKLGLSDSPRLKTVPRPFIKPSTVLIGSDEQIPWPDYSEQIDYELELGVVIGKKAKSISSTDAMQYIAGYTIVNDVSARSATFAKNREKRPWDEFFDWLNGKWADGFMPCGPYLLTADEIENVQNLKMILKVNGEIRQNANTAQMIFPVVDIVSFLSNLMTLEPGDIIATGTPAGVGLGTGRYLQAGDKIECCIEKLGTLTNYLGPKPEKFYQPLANGY